LLQVELIERERSETDRRVVYLAITKKGLDLLTTIDENDTPHMDFINNITEEEAQIVSDIFDRLRND